MLKNCRNRTLIARVARTALTALVGLAALPLLIAPAEAKSRHGRQYHNTRWSTSSIRAVDSGQKKLIWFSALKSPKDITQKDLDNAGKAFDGFVVHYLWGSHDNRANAESFGWEAFSDRRYTLDKSDTDDDYIGDSLDALVKLPKYPMPDRFLYITASPFHAAHFDWTDDAFWDNVCHNLEIASQICHDAGLKGVFLDTEQYHNQGSPNLYNYQSVQRLPRYSDMDYDDLAGIVTKRGEQVIRALNSHDKDMTILVSFGYITNSQMFNRARQGGFLLTPFLDGLLSNSDPSTKFVDAFEAGYWHPDSPNFFNAWHHNVMDRDKYNFKYQKFPDRYARQYQFGVGLFLDRDMGPKGNHGDYGWCGDGKKMMYYSPGRLAYTVQQAVKESDQYVWFYSEKPNAWLTPDSPKGLPSAYIDALRDGLRHGSDPSLKPLPYNSSPIAESEICK